MTKWINQNDILAHPNIHVFIIQGGSLSLAESIWHGVPIIGIPLIVDQFRVRTNHVLSIV